MFDIDVSHTLWTLAIDREGETLRYRMMSSGTIAWEFSHPLSPMADEFNSRLQEAALLWMTLPSAECLNRLKSIGNVLYSLMVPPEVRERMPADESALVISTREQNYHFELIHDGRQFWGCKYGIGRQLVGYQPRQQAPERTGADTACLMLANPSDDLMDAEREASALLEFLQGKGVECVYMASRQVTSAEIMIQMNANRYDLIHYSGHIGREARGDFAFLLAGGQSFKLKDVASLVGFGNPFVFLNGCGDLLSNKESEKGLVYDGLVAPFIYAGACAVVGTRWKVDDAAARRFAESFYGHVLAGKTLGEAMAAARTAACEKADMGAWSAFLLFGNPNLKLAAKASNAAAPDAASEAAHMRKPATPNDTSARPGPSQPAAVSAFLPNGRLNMSALSAGLSKSLDAGYQLSGGVSLLSTTHWLVGYLLCGDDEAKRLFSRLGLDNEQAGAALALMLLDGISPAEGYVEDAENAEFSTNLIKALRQAADIARRSGGRLITGYDVLSSMMDMSCSMEDLLKPLGLDATRLCAALSEM